MERVARRLIEVRSREFLTNYRNEMYEILLTRVIPAFVHIDVIL